jgi:hypothetical protein
VPQGGTRDVRAFAPVVAAAFRDEEIKYVSRKNI